MRMRSGNVTDFILGLLTAGMFVVTLGTLPGVVLYLEKKAKMQNRSFRPRSIENAFRRLERQKLLRIRKKNGAAAVELTSAGKNRIREFEINNLELKRGEMWDRQWRLVLFDIPERYKKSRDALSLKLKQLGMYRLHKSVFVFPGDCEDEIEFLSQHFQIEPYVTVLHTLSLGAHEADALQHFGEGR